MDKDTLKSIKDEAIQLANDRDQLQGQLNIVIPKLEALESILKAYDADDEVKPQIKGTPPQIVDTSVEEDTYIPYTEKLREYISSNRGVNDVVTNRQFDEWLQNQFPDKELNSGSLSTAWRMIKEKNWVTQIRRGNRHSPAVYRINEVNDDELDWTKLM